MRQRQAERNLAVAVERVLKAWDMGDDLSDVMEDLRKAALEHARFDDDDVACKTLEEGSAWMSC